jgi:ferredoxin
MARTPRRLQRVRAAVLAGVNVLILVHLWAYYGLGLRGVGSIDFQEFFRSFLARGVVNAGALFTAGVLLASLVVGRAFCGWGCHFGAFQELCRALLVRLGLRPAVTHSGWTAVLPAVVLGYWFLWPPVARWLAAGLPPLSLDPGATAIWELLPGPVVAVATFLVNGLALTLFFGTRAFCRLLCPWGLLLKPLNAVAAGGVARVGACIGCGGCVRACAMGIDVQGYVEREGRVTAADCIRCLECVSACPVEAIGWRFARPAPRGFRTRRAVGRRLRAHEHALLVGGAAATLPWVVHLGGTSPLLATALGAAVGIGAVTVARLAREPEVRLGRWTLKDGTWRPGGVAVAACVAAAALAILVAGAPRAGAWLGGRLLAAGVPRLALVPLRAAAILSPGDPALALSTSVAHAQRGDVARSLAEAERAARLAPESVAVRRTLAVLYRRSGRTEDAVTASRRAAALAPTDRAVWTDLCRLYLDLGRRADAEACGREAVRRGVFPPAGAPGAG